MPTKTRRKRSDIHIPSLAPLTPEEGLRIAMNAPPLHMKKASKKGGAKKKG
jgi:hypothetical protein